MKCFVDKTTFNTERTEITNTEILKQIKGYNSRFGEKNALRIGDEILTYDSGENFRLRVKEAKENEIIFENITYKGER